MNIYVMGAGAVGGYFGGRLSAAGQKVTMVCRGRTREVIDRAGIRIESVDGDVQARPRTVERPDGAVKADVILWAVKTYQNEDAVAVARPLVGEGTAVVSLQNGVEAVDELGGAFGQANVVGGFASIAAEVVEPCVIRHTALGRLTLGELDGRPSDRVRAIADVLAQAKIPHQVSTNIRRDLWGKLVWNAAFNPLSVLLRSTVEELLRHLPSMALLKRAMDETLAVAKAEGYEISPKLIERYLDVKEQSGEFRTSMFQDFARGRTMEVDAICGAVVRHGRRRGVPVPVNEMFFDVLRYLEERRVQSPSRNPSQI